MKSGNNPSFEQMQNVQQFQSGFDPSQLMAMAAQQQFLQTNVPVQQNFASQIGQIGSFHPQMMNQQQMFRNPKYTGHSMFPNMYQFPQGLNPAEIAQKNMMEQMLMQNQQMSPGLNQQSAMGFQMMDPLQNAYKDMMQGQTPQVRPSMQMMEPNEQGQVVNEFLLKILNMFVVQNEVLLEFKVKNQQLEATVTEVTEQISKLQQIVESKLENDEGTRIACKRQDSSGSADHQINQQLKMEDGEGVSQRKKNIKKPSSTGRLKKTRAIISRSRSRDYKPTKNGSVSDSDRTPSDYDEDWSKVQKKVKKISKDQVQ